MTTQPASYPRHRFAAEITSHAVSAIYVFSLSLRDIGLTSRSMEAPSATR